MNTPRLGEIYWAELESDRPRPVLIVSREEFNQGTDDDASTVVIPFTTKKLESRRALPNCVYFSAGEFALPKACVAQVDANLLLLKSEIHFGRGPISRLDGPKMRDVVKAIGVVVGADCEPISV